MTHPKLLGWTVQRIATESGCTWATIHKFITGRLISGWAEHRLKGTLTRLGVNKTP